VFSSGEHEPCDFETKDGMAKIRWMAAHSFVVDHLSVRNAQSSQRFQLNSPIKKADPPSEPALVQFGFRLIDRHVRTFVQLENCLPNGLSLVVERSTEALLTGASCFASASSQVGCRDYRCRFEVSKLYRYRQSHTWRWKA